QILESIIEPVAYLVPNDPADADPAWFGQRFETRRDVHAISEDVMFIDDHIAEVYADAEPDLPFLGHLRLAVEHRALDLVGTAHGFHNTYKFRQETVARVLYCSAPVLFDFGINQNAEMRLEPLVCPFFIHAHQTRIPCHVGG